MNPFQIPIANITIAKVSTCVKVQTNFLKFFKDQMEGH